MQPQLPRLRRSIGLNPRLGFPGDAKDGRALAENAASAAQDASLSAADAASAAEMAADAMSSVADKGAIPAIRSPPSIPKSNSRHR